MRRELSSSQLEAISDWRETTTRGRAVTWMVSKATVNFSDGKGEAMEPSDLHWLFSGAAGKVFASRSLEGEEGREVRSLKSESPWVNSRYKEYWANSSIVRSAQFGTR